VTFLADTNVYSYSRPFLQPMPVWDYWYLLLLPLVIAVAVVYKAIKCRTIKQVPREAASIAAWILVCFAAAAVALVVLVKLMEW
jgi:hypothetical protein